MNNTLLSDLLYEPDEIKVITFLNQCANDEELYVFAFNYNWSNGFAIPRSIVDNPCCSISTALLTFYRADGFSYLMNKSADTDIKEWYSFISELYTKVLNGNFKSSKIPFTPPLSKVQVFKLRKLLNNNESIFLSSIEGKDCDIEL